MSHTHVTVTSRREGFHRAGRAWGTAPETVAVADFTPEQMAALEADPMLAVVPAVPQRPAPSAEERAAYILAGARWLRDFRAADEPPPLTLLGLAAGVGRVTAAEWDAAWAASESRAGDDPEGGAEAASGDPPERGDDPASGSDPAAGDPERDHAIAAAIDRLDLADPDCWTKDGRPTLAALRAAGAPEDLTAEERDRVWADMNPGAAR